MPPIQRLRRVPWVSRFLSDPVLRARLSLYAGLAVNLIYAGFKLVSSWVFASVWMGAIAVYYIVLAVMRGMLAYEERRAAPLPGAEKEKLEWRAYRLCGWSMLALNIGMTGMVIQMVRQGQHYSYPGNIIYGSAFYAFYALIVAVVNVVRFRKLKSPVLSAAKAISLAAALMSILALQTAMLTRFGDGSEMFSSTMNTITGTAVCLATFGIAFYMVLRARRSLAP